MGELITLYELFQSGLITDQEALEIGKIKGVEKIIQIDEKQEVQVMYEGIYMRSYKYKEADKECNAIYNLNNNRCINCGVKNGHPCEINN